MPSKSDRETASSAPHHRRELGAGWVAGLFLVIGAAWVVLGEWLVATRAGQPPGTTHLQLIKGLLFVAGTGVLLFLLLRWRDRRRAEVLAPTELLLSQVPGMLWTTDRELRVVTFVGSEVMVTPRSPERYVGRPVTELIDDPERREMIARGHRSALAGEVAEIRVRLRGRTFLTRVEPRRDPGGRINGCVGFALEMTDLPDDEVPGARGALHQTRSMASLGALVLAVAHQFKNPLFAMSAALDAFEQRIGPHPATDRHRAILREQLKRMVRLVTALQEYGQIRLPEMLASEVGTLIGRVAAGWQERAAKAGVVLEVETPPAGELVAQLDPAALSHALGALIANALEHTPPGGTVLLAARRSPEGLPLEITVHDSGPGFRPEDLERAARPLFSRRPGGTGLGLAVVERIVLFHGGHLELGTSPRGGARVTLHLPLHTAA